MERNGCFQPSMHLTTMEDLQDTSNALNSHHVQTNTQTQLAATHLSLRHLLHLRRVNSEGERERERERESMLNIDLTAVTKTLNT